MSTPDMDVIKEIPGYKVILKAVLKSQIQQLVGDFLYTGGYNWQVGKGVTFELIQT